MSKHLKHAVLGVAMLANFTHIYADEICKKAVPFIDAPLGEISKIVCDDAIRPQWHREWFEIGGLKVIESERLFWTGEVSKDNALWIFNSADLFYPRSKDQTGYGEITCSGGGKGLYLVDLSKKPPKIIQFGVDKACNEFDWASWGTKNAVIALKKDVRFTYDRQTGKMSLPKDIDAIWEGMIIPTPTGKTSRDTPYPNYVKPYVKEVPLPAQGPK